MSFDAGVIIGNLIDDLKSLRYGIDVKYIIDNQLFRGSVLSNTDKHVSSFDQHMGYELVCGRSVQKFFADS